MSKLEDDLKFLMEAYAYAAEFSTDPNTQTGVVIVKRGMIIAKGANHEPKGVKLTAERSERPLKYSFVEHAERNAIYSAARKGIKLEKAILYSPWFPCAKCARAIIQSGIERLVTHKEMLDFTTRYISLIGNEQLWDHSQYHALQMFGEAEVECKSVSGKIGNVKIKYRGEVFEP